MQFVRYFKRREVRIEDLMKKMLADPGHRVIDRYGQLNPQLFMNDSNRSGYVVPHPAEFTIDRSGRVTWKYTNTDASVRATNEQILAALKALEKK